VTCALASAFLAALSLGGCSPPAPRSFDFFLSDPIVRDGVIARCDAHLVESQVDVECANARRAATTEQLREEQAKRKELEQESERKLEALRRQYQRAGAREAETQSAAGKAAPASGEAPDRATEQTAFGVPLQPPLVGVPSVGSGPALPAEPPPEPRAELPPDAPAEVPPDTSAELPHDAPAELPHDAPAELPHDTPAELPKPSEETSPGSAELPQ
jgi:hypothetical protein